MSYIGNQPTTVAFLTDQFSGNGSTTAFTMSVAPATTSSILVAITGVVQDPSTYAVSGTTLTFSAAPPSGTGNISVRYLGIPASGVTTTAYRTVTEFTATAGQTTFSVPSYTVGYINVYVNGSRLGSSDYTASNGITVVLAAAATAGDLVTAESFYVSSVLNAIPATAGAVNSTYIATGAVGTTQLADAGVTQSKFGTNVSGTGPAFSAYLGSNQSISSGTATKLQFNTEEYDTNNNYDTSTYRFTPTVAGYYLVTCSVTIPNGNVTCTLTSYIFKNGANAKFSTTIGIAGISTSYTTHVSAVIYLNGSTDYVEGYAMQNTSSTQTISASSSIDYFQASLIRAA